jgi:uncharacterized protein
MPSRRTVIAGMAAALLPRPGWAEAGAPAWLACAREADGGFALFGMRADGGIAFRIALPARGHAGARHPVRPLAVVMARRPGGFALVLDCASGTTLARLTPPAGIHFNGHAAFVQGGAVLATSEQHADTSAGQVGLWDSATWHRIGSWSSDGIGPHEVLALPGDRLAVANGGIATDPTDRRKLNLDAMRPSLVVLDGAGTITDRLDLPPALRRNSIRHIAAHGGRIALAMQWEGDPAETVPLLALWTPGQTARFCDGPDSALMQGYAGSVAWSGDGTQVAITSPRGGRMQVFDRQGAHRSSLTRPDICGLAPGAGDPGFLASDGAGGLIAMHPGAPRLLARHPVAWDNHILALQPGASAARA